MREIEKFYPLQIGFLSYSKEKVCYAMRDFCEQNKDDIKKFNELHCYIELKDGTKIFGVYNKYCIKEKWFDQLIIHNGVEFTLNDYEFNLLENAKFATKFYSCVPDEYQILYYYDYDKGE